MMYGAHPALQQAGAEHVQASKLDGDLSEAALGGRLSPIQLKLTSELRSHPFSLGLYQENGAPDDFVQTIRYQGILVPLAVKADGTIVSGHRRWQAARLLGIEAVPVQVVHYESELQEREAIISSTATGGKPLRSGNGRPMNWRLLSGNEPGGVREPGQTSRQHCLKVRGVKPATNWPLLSG